MYIKEYKKEKLTKGNIITAIIIIAIYASAAAVLALIITNTLYNL